MGAGTSAHAAASRSGRQFVIHVGILPSFIRLRLFGTGGDLLSHLRSTIGAEVLNFRVRDGIGCFTLAMTTGSKQSQHECLFVVTDRFAPFVGGCGGHFCWAKVAFSRWDRLFFKQPVPGSDQVDRAISTGQLHALLRFDLRPIDVVVFHGPDRETLF